MCELDLLGQVGLVAPEKAVAIFLLSCLGLKALGGDGYFSLARKFIRDVGGVYGVAERSTLLVSADLELV